MKRGTYRTGQVLLAVIVLCSALFLAACAAADSGASPESPDGQPAIPEAQADQFSDAPPASSVVAPGAEAEDTLTDAVPAASTEIVDTQSEATPTGKQGQGGSSNAEENTEYAWKDGDRTLTVTLQPDLVVDEDDSGTSKSEARVAASGGAIVKSVEGQDQKSGQPVFKSQSGALMTLPGGVLLVLDADWTATEVNAFFAGNGIKQDQISELDFVDNGYFVETEPGFPSLNLANKLASQDGVIISSPNWWTEVTTK